MKKWHIHQNTAPRKLKRHNFPSKEGDFPEDSRSWGNRPESKGGGGKKRERERTWIVARKGMPGGLR